MNGKKIIKNLKKIFKKGNALSFSLLSMLLTVGLSSMAFFTKLKQKKLNLYEIAKANLRKKTELRELKVTEIKLY